MYVVLQKIAYIKAILREISIYIFIFFMLLMLLLLIPIVGIFIISTGMFDELSSINIKRIKVIALTTSIVNLFVSLIIFILFDFSSNQFQFVQEYHEITSFDFYLGVDGLSIYFVLLTTIIMPISLLSNWTSISENVRSYVIIILLLETLLLAVFLVLDILLFYIFFESILPPLFILIGLFGSSNRVRASFYLFLYTLLGSLFLLLSILTMSSIMGTTDFDALYKTNFNYYTQLFLFYGIFIAFAVKTPTIFLNTWLLKAHVESPLGGSIILAAIVLKLSLYGILRLILPLLPKASIDYTSIVYLIGVITIIYASLSTLRTIDVKELIAYSSVSHAAVYLLGAFSNTIQGIEGGIALGLAHGFVSSGLFICAGGVLYDRSSTRLITYYRGIAQVMPLFSILFFILCLGNAGTPLTFNFVGEFMCLYGTFERLPLLGAFACSSIVFSAAFTIFMFNRIAFAGSFSKYFLVNIPDLNKREFYILLTLVVFTVILGIYPAPVLDGLHYSVSSLIYNSPIDYDINSLYSLLPLFCVARQTMKSKKTIFQLFIIVSLALVGIWFLLDSMLEGGNHYNVFTVLIGKGVNFIVCAFTPFFIITINSSFKVACLAFYFKTLVNFNLYIQRLLSLYSPLLILFFFVNSLFLYPLICLTLFILCLVLLLTIIYFLFEEKSDTDKNPVLSWVIIILSVLFLFCLFLFVIFSSIIYDDIISYILNNNSHNSNNPNWGNLFGDNVPDGGNNGPNDPNTPQHVMGDPEAERRRREFQEQQQQIEEDRWLRENQTEEETQWLQQQHTQERRERRRELRQQAAQRAAQRRL